MKKLIASLCALTLLFTLTACSGKKNEGTKADDSVSSADTTQQKEFEANKEEDNQTEKQSAPTEIEENEELTAEQLAYLYNRAYTVASDWFGFYNSYWDNNDRLETENGFYFAIRHDNIKSVSELKNYLYRYFSKNLVDGIIDEYYIERNGKLYKFSPEAGDRLPDYRLNNTRAKIVSDGEGSISCDIIIDAYFDDGPDSPYTRQEYITENVSFILEDGRWVIDNHFTHNLYAPYTWDERSPLDGFAAVPTTEELREFIPNS